MRRKQEIEQELGSITPILEQAKQAVGLIKSDNLNEIRSLKMPPEPIRDVLEGVLRADAGYVAAAALIGFTSALLGRLLALLLVAPALG